MFVTRKILAFLEFRLLLSEDAWKYWIGMNLTLSRHSGAKIKKERYALFHRANGSTRAACCDFQNMLVRLLFIFCRIYPFSTASAFLVGKCKLTNLLRGYVYRVIECGL